MYLISSIVLFNVGHFFLGDYKQENPIRWTVQIINFLCRNAVHG